MLIDCDGGGGGGGGGLQRRLRPRLRSPLWRRVRFLAVVWVLVGMFSHLASVRVTVRDTELTALKAQLATATKGTCTLTLRLTRSVVSCRMCAVCRVGDGQVADGGAGEGEGRDSQEAHRCRERYPPPLLTGFA